MSAVVLKHGTQATQVYVVTKPPSDSKSSTTFSSQQTSYEAVTLSPLKTSFPSSRVLAQVHYDLTRDA
nr:hypothetical protein CFP56_02803 [Quercus suber]